MIIENRKLKIYAKKSLGQNFIVNEGIIKKIIDASEVGKDDIVLEIGPGTGLLTQALITRAKKLIAIEKDSSLVPILRDKFKNYNVEIIEADILEFVPELPADSYKVVGNIPYYLTSHLLRVILEQWPKPQNIVLTIQKEVAQRIMVKPPNMNLLALSVQYYTEPKIIARVSRGSFRPMPKVDSAVIKLIPRDGVSINLELFNLIRAGFSQKRKLLLSNVSDHLSKNKETLRKTFQELNIPETSRAENLSLVQWQELLNKIG